MKRIVAVLSLAVAACSPMAGSPCTTPNATQCAGATSVLVCEGSTWSAYGCPSCEGSTCNWKNAKNGDGCPHAAAGDGWCPFENRVLSCYWSSLADAGVFVETACQGCTVGKSLKELGKTCP